MNLEKRYLLSKVRNEMNNVESRVNWDELLVLLNKHKLLPFLYSEIADEIPKEYKKLYEYQLKKSIESQKKLWMIYKEIILLAEQNEVKIVLPKGFPVANELYGNIDCRVSADIDLLVRKEDIEKVCEMMAKIGAYHRHNGRYEDFVKNFNSDRFDNFYELKFMKFFMGEQLLIEVKKATDAIPEKYITEFIDSAVISKIEGYNVWRLDNEHMFVHLCANVHKDTEGHEGICSNVFRLRNFIDLQQYIKVKGKETNWEYVKDIAVRCDVLHKVLWALRKLGELIPQIKNNHDYNKALSCCGNPKHENAEINNETLVEWKTDFVTRFFDNALAKEEYMELVLARRWSDDNPFYGSIMRMHCDQWVSLEGIQALSYLFEYRDGMVWIRLKTASEKKVTEILDKDRLYFSFIGKERVTEEDIDAIGNPSKGVVFFVVDGVLMAKVGNKTVWTINEPNLRNDQISGCDEVHYNEAEAIYEIEFDISDVSKGETELAYNIWLDGAVLDDFYKHVWYKYQVDQDYGIVSIKNETTLQGE